MEERDLQNSVVSLVKKIKYYLITVMGLQVHEASERQIYYVLSMALKEEIMINWTASLHSIKKNKPTILYYLCMEYMPGRMLRNNVLSMRVLDLVKTALKQINRDFDLICQQEPEPALGNGGLGRLASCLLDSLATHHYPAIAYGLRYQYGIFQQDLVNGIQVEKPETWLFYHNPWESRKDTLAKSVHFGGFLASLVGAAGNEGLTTTDYEEVRAIPFDIPIVGYRNKEEFNVTTLRLWTTKESPRNFQLQRFNAGFLDQAIENTCLTDVLYPNDNNRIGKRFRLKQEFLLTSASLQDILANHLSIFPDLTSFADKARIHLNDTHPSMVIAELMRLLIQEHHFVWDQAWDLVKNCCNFTNHTVLREALEGWNIERFKVLLPMQYHIIEKINAQLCQAIASKFPGDEGKIQRMSILQNEQIHMAHLAIYGSHKVNGVSNIHTEILKNSLFKDFYQFNPEQFLNITNGVTQRRFLLAANPLLADWICERIGSSWLLDFTHIKEIIRFADDPKSQLQFLEIKKQNKLALMRYLRKSHELPLSFELDETALFDVQIKRIHEYKRQLMNLLHLLIVYHELKIHPESRKIKRIALLAGKAAPGYDMAKKILQLIYCLAKKINTDPDTNQKLGIVFIKNYNVTSAELIIPAADLSEQISTAGTEASGTGNMKLAMNGALTIATHDGANVELEEAIGKSWWPFSFGQLFEQNREVASHYDPWDTYLRILPIRQALDALKDHSLASNEEEHQVLCSIYHVLLEPNTLDRADKYFVINDLHAYYETQKTVEALYLEPLKWAECAIRNLGGTGPFSSDQAIHNYASRIWDLHPSSIDPAALVAIRAEYIENDKCRILS